MPREVSNNLNVKKCVLYNLMNVKEDFESCQLYFVALILDSIYPKDLLGEILSEEMERVFSVSQVIQHIIHRA